MMNNDMVLISVLMCVYNEDSHYIRMAIESILNQTFRNFEFIIVCDSPDNERVKNIVSEYYKKDARIVYYINSSNLGLTKSLNVGLSLCHGKYIARMDADDIALPKRLEKQLAFLEKHEVYTACSTAVKLIDYQGKTIGKRIPTLSPQKIAVKGLFASPLLHPASMIRRVVNGKVIHYDETLRYAQDYGLWSSLPIGSLANIPEVLLEYRISEKQITNTKREEQKACANSVQIDNLKRRGLYLTKEEKGIYDFLINGIDYSATKEEIETLIIKIFEAYKGIVDQGILYCYLADRYIHCLCCHNVDIFHLISSLNKLSKKIGIFSYKPMFFAIYTKLQKRSHNENISDKLCCMWINGAYNVVGCRTSSTTRT